MAIAVEDIVNQSLRAIGVKKRIAWIYEGSPSARAALEIYGQTRDAVMRAQDWSFARGGSTTLTLLKGPPPNGGYTPGQPWSAIYPPPGFLYEYAYPSDMLELRALMTTPLGMFDLDPRPATWRIDNDLLPVVSGNPLAAAGPAQKVILSNTAGAIAVYRRRVTNPALWEPGFTQLLVDALAKGLAIALQQNLQLGQAAAQQEGQTAQIADMHRG